MQDVSRRFGAEKAGGVSDNYWHFVKSGICALVAALTYWFNSLHPLVQVLLGVMVADVLLGLLRENPRRNGRRVYNFAKGWQSFKKKAGAFILVGMAALIEQKIPGMSQSLSSAVALCFVSHFGLSALNHAAELGLPMPEALREILSKMERDHKPTSGKETKKP